MSRMRLPLAVVLAGGLSVIGLLAGPQDTQVAGVDRGRLAHLDRVLDAHVADGQLPGAVALVLRDGQVIYERAVGFADREAGVRMAPDSLFRIASQTKAITSTAAMMLIEEGRLQLTDPISRWMPTFAKPVVAVAAADGTTTLVPARRPVRVSDLLLHTAGLSYGTGARIASQYEAAGLGPAAGYGWYTADKDEPVCVTMDRLGTLPLAVQPGESWVYGYATDVLGCIVERVSGRTLDAFFRERITGPLGMTDTHFFVPREKAGRLTAVYASNAQGKAVRAPEGARGQGHYVEGPRASYSGGAGLVSTARDYACFLEMIRRGGELDGVRLLSPRSVLLMTTNQVDTMHSTSGLGWGLAFETTDRVGANGLSAPGSFGWGGAYGSVYRVDPDARLTMVLLIQLIPNATDIRTLFPTLVTQAIVSR